jgi:hypothetical protein
VTAQDGQAPRQAVFVEFVTRGAPHHQRRREAFNVMQITRVTPDAAGLGCILYFLGDQEGVIVEEPYWDVARRLDSIAGVVWAGR